MLVYTVYAMLFLLVITSFVYEKGASIHNFQSKYVSQKSS